MRSLSILFILVLAACSQAQQTHSSSVESESDNSALYSFDGAEHPVQFSALLKTRALKVEDLRASDLNYEVKETVRYLFGPLTHRQWAGIQKGEKIELQKDKAFVQDGVVFVPYVYKGTWLIGRNKVQVGNTLKVPVPLSASGLETPNWKSCTENHPGHDGWDMFWYFWDPTRPGCEHIKGQHYQEVTVQLELPETAQTVQSYPEYRKMIRWVDQKPTLSMTFAFGYVEDASVPHPFRDSDFGMREFQKFHRTLKSTLAPLGFQESPILQAEYGSSGTEQIGARFTGFKDGVQMQITVVAAAGIDQMTLFAHSYAKNHEGFFGWFGHSRVGSGFDANNFKWIVSSHPETFSVTSDYQLVYWAGCNSYSYYTLPFFEMKAALNPAQDPKGTKSLDLISNGLPSLFAFNADNAAIVLKALLNFNAPTSYQSLVKEIETRAETWGYEVLVNVLGDEDND